MKNSRNIGMAVIGVVAVLIFSIIAFFRQSLLPIIQKNKPNTEKTETNPAILLEEPVCKTEKPTLAIKFAATTYSITDNAEVTIEITGLLGDKTTFLTQEMIWRAKLEWMWSISEPLELPPAIPKETVTVGCMAMSPHYGSISSDSKQERGLPIKLPIELEFDVKKVFVDEVQGVIHPGKYDVRVAIPTYGKVLRSDYFRITLTAENNQDVKKPLPTYELDATFDSKIYEIKPDTQIHVTLNAVTLGKRDLALTKAMTDYAGLEWNWTDKNDPKHVGKGGGGSRGGEDLIKEPIQLPLKLTLPMEKMMGQLLNLDKPRDPKLKEGERDPHVFDYTVFPGFYDVSLVISTGKSVYKSAPTRIEVIANTQAPKAETENTEEKKP